MYDNSTEDMDILEFGSCSNIVEFGSPSNIFMGYSLSLSYSGAQIIFD